MICGLRTCIVLRARAAHLAFLLCCLFTELRADVSATFDSLRIDGTVFSLTDEMHVEGKVIQKDPHLSSAEVILSAIRINNRGNLDALRFHLIDRNNREAYKDVKEGDWIGVTGHWGQFITKGAVKDVGFNVTSFSRIPAAPRRFADFTGRECRFEGLAKAGGVLRSGDDDAKVEGLKEWPDDLVGKKVEVRGLLRNAGSGWRWQNATWSPAELPGMIGSDITLTGVLWSLNGVWWFEREGDEERICLTSAPGSVLTFDTNLYHGTEAKVTGRLVRQLRPSLNQISLKVDRDLVPHFTVRGAKVEHLVPSGREWDYGWIHGEPQLMRDGLPVLVAQTALVPGLLGDETKSQMIRLYNQAAIKYLQRDSSPKATESVAAQMNAPEADPTVRLICAGILAARNDERGRQVLRDAVADPESDLFPDAIECLFEFPFLPRTDGGAKPEIDWAEEAFVKLIASNQTKQVKADAFFHDPDTKPTLTAADATIYYTRALAWLPLMPSTRVRQSLADYALARKRRKSDESSGTLPSRVIQALCSDPAPLAAEVLHKFGEQCKADRVYELEPIVKKYLQQDDTTVLQQFKPRLSELASSDCFRDGLKPEFVKALQGIVEDLEPELRRNVRLLLIHHSADPVSQLLPLLNDPEWPEKSTLLWELAKFKDPRVIQPVLSFLPKVKDGILPKDDGLRTAYALENAFTTIASAGGDDAVRALIGLLNMDFGRAKADYMTNDGLRRIIAARLIELTGESFGVDAEAWTRWLESRRK